FFSSRRRHTRFSRDWSSDVCSSDLGQIAAITEHRELSLHLRWQFASRPPVQLRSTLCCILSRGSSLALNILRHNRCHDHRQQKPGKAGLEPQQVTITAGHGGEVPVPDEWAGVKNSCLVYTRPPALLTETPLQIRFTLFILLC